MQTSLYYKNSGVIPPLAPALIFTLGAGITWGLAFGYAYAIAYIPFVYISFLLTFFFGMGIGLVVNLFGKLGKARNATFMIASTAVLALIGLYTCWTVWFNAKGAGNGYFISPGILFKMMSLVAEEGVWTIFDVTPTGTGLFAVWALEALVIVGAALFIAISNASDTPFCEECNQWADEERMVGPLAPIADKETFKKQIEQREFTAITDLPAIDDIYTQYSRIVLMSCPDCEQSTRFLTVLHIKIEVDDDGKESEDETNVIKNFIISKEEYDLLLNHPYVIEGMEGGHNEENPNTESGEASE